MGTDASELPKGTSSGDILRDDAGGTLKDHCLTIQHQAEERMDHLVEQMAQTQGIDERLKASDQMRWVRLMNNIRASAEEIVIREIVCA